MAAGRETIVVVVMASLFGGVILIMLITCIIRKLRGPRGFASSYGYDKVNHGLDEEEIEFKNMIESKGIHLDEGDDDLFEDKGDIFAGDKGDLKFNSKDKDRLNMLETLRSNLVSSVNVTKPNKNNINSDDEVSENEQIRL